MSLFDLIQLTTKISGIPGLDTGVALVHIIWSNAENVKVYRQQCRDLSSRCTKLLITLCESSEGMSGTEALRIADEIEATISHVHNRMKEWASLSTLKSFVQQSQIKEGIDSSYREIETCSMQFTFTVGMDLSRGQKDLAIVQERDQLELRETMQNILKNTDEIKAVMEMKPPQAVVENLMQSIQEELQNSTTVPPKERQRLTQDLWQIHQQTKLLPPEIDLTGQVVKTNTDPVACGAFNDIYAGLWLDEEKVALRLPRALVNAPVDQRKFLKEVAIWRRLQHPNVTRFYGICYFGGHVYSVSKWMDNGTAIAYLKSNPEADRLGILSDIASGMEYLHSSNNKIVHGDLRGANVLISQEGRACLSDFGLSSFFEHTDQGSHSVPAGANPYRWIAPEIIKPEIIGKKAVSVSTFTDIWSFGMLCLELMSGQQPFAHISRDINVAFELVEGRLPPRPGPSATSRGLTDELWELMQKCWETVQESRPSIAQIRTTIKQLRNGRESSVSVSGPQGSSTPNGESRQTFTIPPTSVSLHSTAKRPSSSGGILFGRSSISSIINLSHFTPHTRSLSSVTPGIKEPELLSESTDRIRGPLETSPLLFSGSEYTGQENGEDDLPPTFATRGMKVEIPERMGQMHLDSQTIPSYRSRSSEPSKVRSPPSFLGSIYSSPGNFSVESPPAPSKGYSERSLSPSSLNLAVNDPSPIIHRSHNGTIEAGTLEGLVDRLTVGSKDYKKDLEYRKIFLTTYLAFTTGENLFSVLARRFNDAELDSRIARENRPTMRYSVLAVMKDWLVSDYAQTNINVLSQMKEFCLSVTSSSTLMDMARDVATKIDQHICSLQDSDLLSPIPLSPSFVNIPKAADISPRDLAIALSILEGDRYSHILPSDYVAYFKRLPGHNSSIEVASVINNTVVKWVKKSIFRADDLDVRGETLKFFVFTAEECRKLYNFASLTAIVTALDSTAVSRLRLTRDRLKQSRDASRLLRKLCVLIEPKSNHLSYRAALREAKEARKACVPWLAVHLRDMEHVFGIASVVEAEGRPLINFSRCTKLWSKIEEMSQFDAPNLARYREAGPLAYLERELRSVPMHSKTDEALEARSAALEAMEKRMSELRLPQLQSVGFRTR